MGNIIKNQKGAQIASVAISKTCAQSHPCKHEIKIVYDNGQVENTGKGMSGYSLASNTYWKYLSQEDKIHLSYMKNTVEKGDPKYSDMMAELGELRQNDR